MIKYVYKIWDKKESINGCPADKALQGRFDLINDDVYLIYKENNPYSIVFLETFHGPNYQDGDTIEDTAQRQCDMLNEEMERQENTPVIEAEDFVSFSNSQMEVIQQMIKQAVNEALEENSAE